MIITIVLTLLVLAGTWLTFEKMGQPGWASVVPLYGPYCLFSGVYGDGWKSLWLLCPIVNIFIAIKVNFDLSRKFRHGFGFGLGLTLLPYVFLPILGLGASTCAPLFPQYDNETDYSYSCYSNDYSDTYN